MKNKIENKDEVADFISEFKQSTKSCVISKKKLRVEFKNGDTMTIQNNGEAIIKINLTPNKPINL